MSKPFSNLRNQMPLSQQLKAEIEKRKELEKLESYRTNSENIKDE